MYNYIGCNIGNKFLDQTDFYNRTKCCNRVEFTTDRTKCCNRVEFTTEINTKTKANAAKLDPVEAIDKTMIKIRSLQGEVGNDGE